MHGFPSFLLSLAGCSVCGLGGRTQSPSRPRFSPTDASSSSRSRRHGRTSRPRRHGRSSDLGPRRHTRSSDLGPRRHGRARNASPWPDSSPRRRRPLLAPSRRPRCTSLTGTCTERAGCRRTGPPDAKPVYSTHLPSTAFARGRRRLRRCFRSVAAAAADGRRAIAASPWLEGALARPEAGGR
jgi:rRNA maturation protein Nop10